jgi:hypothetical protein
MAEKKRKRVTCPRCGVKYRASHLRCPACEEPNPKAAPRGVSAADRLTGLVLLVVGVLIAVLVLFLLLLAPGVGGRGGMALGTLAFIALGAIFHGVLFLVGIHPRDFYRSWYKLSDLTRFLIIGGLVVLGIGLVVFWFFSGKGEE